MDERRSLMASSGHNLSRTLSASLYRLRYLGDSSASRRYRGDLSARAMAAQLAPVVRDICDQIGATVLHLTSHDYDPHGASATALVADGAGSQPRLEERSEGPLEPPLVAHLEQSHLTLHTYPQIHPDQRVACLRIDVEVATCGAISPWAALPYLLRHFEVDAAVVDYRVRGFWWTAEGTRAIGDRVDDHPSALPPALAGRYEQRSHDRPQLRTWHRRLWRRALAVQPHVLSDDALAPAELEAALDRLQKELAALVS